MTASLFEEYAEPEPDGPKWRRDSEVWETNFCFYHGYRTPWDATCEGFRLRWSEDCDIAPATITRNKETP